MKSLRISALSLALLLSQANAMEQAPVAPVVETVNAAAPAVTQAAEAVKNSGMAAKVGEFFGSVRAKLPAMPAMPSMPSKEEAKNMVKVAPKAAVEFAKANPIKAGLIITAVAAVAYTVYKVCTAKKADKAKKEVTK